MDILLGILLAVSSPVFYIIGLIVFIRWVARGGRSSGSVGNHPLYSSSAAAKLRELASTQSPDVAGSLNKLAAEIDETPPVHGIVAPANHGGASATRHGSTAPAPAPSWTSMNVSDLTKSLDNINIILYLGAFLIVVSAGIFVGYNFSTLSGVFKTVFLGLFAALFYGIGLVLFLRSKKLRPAGVTFTGIGLVLLPLVGLAAYNFTALHDSGPLTWFATSVVTVIIYLITLSFTRQTYVAYLMAFTTLSTFESSVSLFNLPIYWFGWAMATISILLLTLTRTQVYWEEARSALSLSANIFVPISLLLSFFAVSPNGMSQLGVTVGLAGVFYAAMASFNVATKAGEAYWVAALASLPLALGLGLWDSASRTQVAIVMLVVAALY